MTTRPAAAAAAAVDSRTDARYPAQEVDLMLRPMGRSRLWGAVGAGVAAPVTAAQVRAQIEEGAKC